MNIKKLTTLAAVGIVSLLSTFQTPTKTEAGLTPPTSYDYFFRPFDNPSPAPDYWRLGDFNGTISPNGSNDIRFTRTADGAYYNYSYTANNANHSFLPNGLEITMTFNRSNTSWTQVSGTSLYNPTDYTKIGSDNTVGSTEKKLYFKIDNNTNHDYIFHVDISSTLTTSGFYYFLYGTRLVDYVILNHTSINRVHVPSYSTIEYYRYGSSSTLYFDAWYLQDLGVSDAYNAGYDLGETDGYDAGYSDGLNNNPNVLLNGFQAMVGILVNFFLMIVNLEVFGVSITGIFAIIVIFVGIVWVLKLIRG